VVAVDPRPMLRRVFGTPYSEKPWWPWRLDLDEVRASREGRERGPKARNAVARSVPCGRRGLARSLERAPRLFAAPLERAPSLRARPMGGLFARRWNARRSAADDCCSGTSASVRWSAGCAFLAKRAVRALRSSEETEGPAGGRVRSDEARSSEGDGGRATARPARAAARSRERARRRQSRRPSERPRS
jgi:hypothetical protein